MRVQVEKKLLLLFACTLLVLRRTFNKKLFVARKMQSNLKLDDSTTSYDSSAQISTSHRARSLIFPWVDEFFTVQYAAGGQGSYWLF